MIRDDVQFVRNHRYPDGTRQPSFQIHTPVIGLHEPRLLNSQTKGKSIQPIGETEISYEPDWTKKFSNIIDECYKKSPCFSHVNSDLNSLLKARFNTVSELNTQSLLWGLCHLIGLPYEIGMPTDKINKELQNVTHFPLREIHLASHLLEARAEDQSATDRILQLCKLNKCNRYVAGGTAIDSYFELDKFAQASVKVTQQQWDCTEYDQLVGKKAPAHFIKNLSIIDLLASVAAPRALEIITDNFEFMEVASKDIVSDISDAGTANESTAEVVIAD